MTSNRQSIHHYSFEYGFKRFGIAVTDLKVSILNLPNGDDFVLLSDTGKLDSVASCTELIASKIRTILDLDPIQTVWGERYSGYPNRIDLVKYKWDSFNQKYSNPNWEKAPDWMVQYVLKALTPIPLYPRSLKSFCFSRN